MRFVRFDHLPAGRSLELHPRLTVCIGAPAEVLAAVGDAARAVVDGRPLPFDGQVELHGILLGMRDRTFDVGAVAGLDPVLDLGAPLPRSGASGVPSVEILEVSGSGEEVGTVRAGWSSVDQVVSVGPGAVEEDPARRTRRIAGDDLLRLRSEIRSVGGERAVLQRRIEAVRADLDSFARATLEVAENQLAAVELRRSTESTAGIPPEHVPDGRVAEIERRLDLLDAELHAVAEPSAPASVAHDLVERLRSIRVELEERHAERSALHRRLCDAEEQLEQAEREVDRLAVGSTGATAPDPADLSALEHIRDGILRLEEGTAPLGPERRAEIVDLRAEEAILLDRLGYDTYTAFLLGAEDRADLADRADRRARLLQRRDAMGHEVDRLRRQLEDHDSETSRLAAGRGAVLTDAALLVGVPADGLARLTTTELIELLDSRERQSTDRRDRLVAEMDELRREQRALDQSSLRRGERAADLDADSEVDELRQRVAECRRRVALHERATVELAELAGLESELAERERGLAGRISERERLLAVIEVDGAPEPSDPGHPDDHAAPAARRVVTSFDREWQLLTRLGELRSVGSVGSVPLVVAGIDTASGDTPTLLHRVASMSDLVQIVVFSETERVARWADGLGPDAALIRW